MKKKKIIAISCVIICVLCLSVILVSCDENVSSLYKPTNIVYDGSRISWTRVQLADYYTISINGGEEKRVNTNMYTYTTDETEFDVTVSSVIKNKTYSETRHFISLDTITNITVSNSGLLGWPDVIGATGYRIQLNGEVLAEDVTEPHYQAPIGNSRIRVRAVVSGDDSYYSTWSEEKNLNVYSAPSNINYDGTTLSWLGGASSYEVNVNGVVQTANSTKLLYNSQNQDFIVEIKALGDHLYNYDSTVSQESFHYLQPATNLTVKNGILYWDKVQPAEGYEIRINNVIQKNTITEASYDKLSSGIQLAVEIRPFNLSGKYFSTWSTVKNIYILQTPIVHWNSDLELDGEANNNYIWDLVNGAAGYEVSIEKDGIETSQVFGATITAFGYAYSEIGVYKIRIKATGGQNTDYSDSKYSETITVERLAAPKMSSVNSDPNNVSKGFTVNYTGVSGASGYQLYKDGALLSGKFSTVLSITDNDVADDSIAAHQNYTYIVRSMGAVKTINGGIYVALPCLTANALSFNIQVQAMPTTLNIEGYTASWSAVSGANDYAIAYSGNTYTSSQTSYNLSALLAGSYEISVCTRGNGGTTLASNYSAPITVKRLTAPYNIRITYGAGEGQLEFDSVANATGYEVYYDENADAIPENAWDNMYQFIRESGTTLSMRSVANRWNDLRTIYFMTSEASQTQQFIRLAAPTFPEAPFGNSAEFVWNAPSNINTAEYTPTYQVFEGEVTQTGGVQNGTKYTISYLEGGKNYVFRVKAIGNDTKYLDSEMSASVPIYKLATPQLSIKNNEYHWNGVANATAYVLVIDGERVDNQQHISTGDYYYKPSYTTTGTHSVKLYAVGDSGYNNINSDTFNYAQIVKQCLAPEIKFRYTDTSVSTGGAIEVTITKASDNCTKYQYEIAGDSIVSSSLKESKQIESTGTYSIRVKALGGTFDNNDAYYTDSQYVGGGTGYSIILLAPPTHNSFSLNSDGAFKWASITDSLGYDYLIQFDAGDFSIEKHVGTAALDPITDFRNYKTITIRVRSSGNGSNIITSAWIEFTWTNPNYQA